MESAATPGPDNLIIKEAAFVAALDLFERDGAGLPSLQSSDNEHSRLLTLTTDQRRGMSDEECGEAATCLATFALHLQRVQNREQARLDRLVDCIDAVVALAVDKVQGWKFEERRLKAVRANPTAVRLDAERVLTQGKLTRVTYLANRVEFLAKAFLSLQQSRRSRGQSH